MITNQALLFFIFVINGLLIGILFDVFRILRISFKTKDFVTYIEDITFWILTGSIILYSIFIFNNGEIRFFIFIGIIIGVILYMMLFSSHIIKISVFVIKFFKKILSKIIFNPIKILFKFIRKMLSKPVSIITINLRKLIKQKNVKITK